MVRTVYIQRKVLEIYRLLPKICYPIDVREVVRAIPQKSAIMSYSELAFVSNSSISDVMCACGSESGATHFDPKQNRFLILYNDGINPGRQLWTKCHEVGHIVLGHFAALESSKMANGEGLGSPSEFEDEADRFAWNLMAPLPIMREMGIETLEQTRETFGFSGQAAALQFDRYRRWLRGYVKTAWDNNLLREFRAKRN